eukprot:jgi/Undpi1/12568/HiC_scaffold_6.g02237.m1
MLSNANTQAAQQAEVYWMAVVRDIPFSQFDTNELTRLAAENLQDLPDFKGLNIPRSKGGKIDPVTDLFRTDWPGVTTGPVVSQFMLSDFLIDSIVVTPKADPLFPGMDYMTAFQPWLDNGASEVETIFDTDNPRFIRNGRDLATVSFADHLYIEAFRAALILFTQGALGGSIGPRAPDGWQVHRVLRPEAYGGLVHNTLMKDVITPLPASLLKNTVLLDLVKAVNKRMNPDGEETFLLPMAVAEGSPTHPAYPSGHAINVGGYITALKAFLGFEGGQKCFPNPVVSNDAGTKRIKYRPSGREIVDECIDKRGRKVDGLTYEGELNKVSANVLIGRSHLGVHWRMDGVNGALVGETSTVRRLQQELPGLPEARDTDSKKKGDDDDIPPATYKFRLYSGKILQLYASNLFRLDDKFCRGLFTEDDFCDDCAVEVRKGAVKQKRGTFSLKAEL